MQINIPSDIRAEIVYNYLEGVGKDIVFLGPHKRNAYEDILSVSHDGDVVKIELSRQGLYDILPEALFHPIDRFDNLPANEYKERFAEEVERQRAEESNARIFFSAFDKCVFELSSEVTRLKNDCFGDNRVLSDIICDTLPEKYRSNRFVDSTRMFMPRCRSIRGNVTLITLMLRKVLADEGLKLIKNNGQMSYVDMTPRYNCRLPQDGISSDLYLGNCYDEDTLCYDVRYWNDDFCDSSFLDFADEIKVYEEFINDYFMGIETSLRLNLSTQTLPVRISDEICYNYLNYNTNL